MPFDYMHSTPPLQFAHAPEKAELQYRSELEDRAALLYRLGYDREAVTARLRGNMAWDWECSPRPAFVAAVEQAIPAIVEKVFSRAKPPEKGRRVTAATLKTLPSD
jgi:hypothetical protein